MSSASSPPAGNLKSFSVKDILPELEEVNETVVKKRFKCELCQSSYSQKFVLSQHIRKVHKKETPYKCEFCSYTAVINSDLTKHKTKHGIFVRSYPCRYCNEVFQFSVKRKNHENIHLGKVFTCKICEKQFHCKSTFQIHLKSHDKIRCTQCHRCFENVEALRSHEFIHSKNKENSKTKIRYSKIHNLTTICSVCNHDVSSFKDLKNHVLKKHLRLFGPNIKEMSDVLQWNSAGECPINQCGSIVKNGNGQFTHLLSHLGILPYKCHLCQYQSRWIVNLKTHFLSHDKFPDMKCKHCLKFFKHKSHLSHHVTRVHGDYSHHKLHLCEICGKDYLSINTLKKHYHKVHKANTKLYCSICKIKFETETDFKLHMKVHKEGKHCCSKCGKKFLRKDNLNKHYFLHHQTPEFYPSNSVNTLQEDKQMRNQKLVCFLCDAGTHIKNGEFISVHIRKTHPSVCFQCDICKRIFASHVSLSKHFFSHAQRLFDSNCEVYIPSYESEDEELFKVYNKNCDKDTDENSFALNHSFLCECSICGLNGFSFKELVKHERTHTNLLNKITKTKFSINVKKENVRQFWENTKTIRYISDDGSFLKSTLAPYENTIKSTNSVIPHHKTNAQLSTNITLPSTKTNSNKSSNIFSSHKTNFPKSNNSIPLHHKTNLQLKSTNNNLSLHSEATSQKSTNANHLLQNNKYIKLKNGEVLDEFVTTNGHNILIPTVNLPSWKNNNISNNSHSDLRVNPSMKDYIFYSKLPETESNLNEISNPITVRDLEKEFVLGTKIGKRKVKEKTVHVGGRKIIVTEDCGFVRSQS